VLETAPKRPARAVRLPVTVLWVAATPAKAFVRCSDPEMLLVLAIVPASSAAPGTSFVSEPLTVDTDATGPLNAARAVNDPATVEDETTVPVRPT
jgi:hypothetical protein